MTARELSLAIGVQVRESEPLAPHTTFRIGGVARLYGVVSTKTQLLSAISAATDAGIPFFILGGGSNVLFADEGFNGFVIKIKLNGLEIYPEGRMCVEAGVPWARVLEAAAGAGLAGLEWGADIPGSFGGAVRGNAGAYGGETKDVIESVTVVRDGHCAHVSSEACGFAYRDSGIKRDKEIIVDAMLRLRHDDPARIRSVMREIMEKRRAKLPAEPSAGSDFKNIVIADSNRTIFMNAGVPAEFFERGKVPAGWLIQQLGLPGTTIGKAQISPKHGNIIINTGGAQAADVLRLLALMKSKVRERYGIELEEEIEVVGSEDR